GVPKVTPVERAAGYSGIEDALCEAFSRLHLAEPPNIHVSSRTDSGVHALCNTAHADLIYGDDREPYEPDSIVHTVNRSFLHMGRNDIRLMNCQLVPPTFNSRHQALGRTYLYRVVSGCYHSRLPIPEANRSWGVIERLDIEAMQEAAKHFLGTHDFTTFRNKTPETWTKDPVKTMKAVEIRRALCLLEEHDPFSRSFSGHTAQQNRVIRFGPQAGSDIRQGSDDNLARGEERETTYCTDKGRGKEIFVVKCGNKHTGGLRVDGGCEPNALPTAPHDPTTAPHNPTTIMAQNDLSVPRGPAPPYDFQLQVVMVGESSVGKTCIINRFTEDKYEDPISTVGIDFKIRIFEMYGKRIRLQIWDTAGHEKFNTITTQYYHRADGVLLVYDITREHTFVSIPKWLNQVDVYASHDVERYLLGNKCDQEVLREVPRERAEKFAVEYNINFVEVSAKTNTGIEHAFRDLVESILRKRPDAATMMDERIHLNRGDYEKSPQPGTKSCSGRCV
ncbi:Ras- protein Rab-13, partial [Branchiostoma belcheri]